MEYTLRCNRGCLDLESPKVMAILNMTPDSFCRRCSSSAEADILSQVSLALQEGADIIDVGGCSTRPGSSQPDAKEEWARIEPALRAIRRTYPDTILSLDTFRADVAERAIGEYGVDIINDISGGMLDPEMDAVLTRTRVPYILMHMRGTPETMQGLADYEDLLSEMIDFFQRRLDTLYSKGVSDVVIDPGFGFAKTLEQNYYLLRNLHVFRILQAPILVGVSRKSMIYRALDITPEQALNGTTALHMLALTQGAHILRVHDVRAAKEAVQLYQLYCGTAKNTNACNP